MKNNNFNFSAEKNLKVIQERNVSFEEIISTIENGGLLDILEHPNLDKYGNQKMYLVEFKHYVYLVPYIVENDGTIFLKTIIPSRKATKKYLEEFKNEK